MSCRLLSLLVYSLVVFGLLVFGRTEASFGQEARGEPNARLVAEIPVRYNGRVTTLETAARAVVLRIAGQDFAADSDGQRHSALEVYLDCMSGHARLESLRLFPVDKPLREAMEMDERTHFTRSELPYAKLDEHLKPGQDISDGESPLTEDAHDLNGRLFLASTVEFLHFSPEFVGTDRLSQAFNVRDRLEDVGTPRLVPPRDGTAKWSLLTFAALEDFAAENDIGDHKPYPAAKLWGKILSAYLADDAPAFAKQVKEYQDFLLKHPFPACPIHFEAPPGWIEDGVPRPYDHYAFSDTLEIGLQVAKLSFHDGDDILTLSINHFPGIEIDVPMTVAAWQLQNGIVPMSDAQMEQLLAKQVSIADMPNWHIKMERPTNIPRPRYASDTFVIPHAAGTFVVSTYGPPQKLERHKAVSDRFVESLTIGEKQAVIDWFPVDQTKTLPDPFASRVIGAWFSDDKRHWILSAYTTEDDEEWMLDGVRELVGSIRATDEKATKTSDAVEWSIPKGWSLDPGDDVIFWVQRGNRAVGVVHMRTVSDVPRENELSLLRLLRKQSDFSTIPDSELMASLKTVKYGDREVREFRFEREIVPDLPTPEFAMKVPDEWKPVPGSAFTIARYDAGEKCEVSVSKLPAPTADERDSYLANNFNRWRLQLALETLDDEKSLANADELKTKSGEALFIYLVGDEQAIAAVVVIQGDAAWFVRMRGPTGGVAQRLASFRETVKSFELRDNSSNKR